MITVPRKSLAPYAEGTRERGAVRTPRRQRRRRTSERGWGVKGSTL